MTGAKVFSPLTRWSNDPDGGQVKQAGDVFLCYIRRPLVRDGSLFNLNYCQSTYLDESSDSK